jgi:hypothetical protein
VKLSPFPKTQSEVPFGKYAGKPLEILLADKGYLRWLNNQPSFMSWLARRHPELPAKILAAVPSLDDRIQAFVAAAPAAISGQGGSYRTFSVACALVWGFTLSDSEALRYLRIYNQRCQPAWPEADLKQKIKCAGKAGYHDKPRGYLL